MNRFENITKEILQEYVNECNSMQALCRKLGYASNGHNYKTVQRYLDKYNIDTSNWFYQRVPKQHREFANVFCENSSATQATLRRWYVRGQYSEYVCSICGQQPFWNGKELVLTLDHINGNNHDNRLTNLRWVCPNCDRQLPTFGFRNHKKEIKELKEIKLKQKHNFCKHCGVEISARAKLCVSCSYI